MKKGIYILNLLVLICFFLLSHFLPENSKELFIFSFCFYVIESIIFYLKKETHLVVFLIFLQGFLLKLFYISYTGCYNRQHDVGTFANDNNRGHFEYISYILTHNTLPFFHQPPYFPIHTPPLHHILSAIFMKAGFSLEGLQYISMLTALGISILSFYILCPLIKSDTQRCMIAGVCFFFPTLTLLSGSLNNDTLFTFLAVACIFFFLRFLHTSRKKDFILSGVLLGVAGLTKFTALSIYYGILGFYILAFISKKIAFKKMIKLAFYYSCLSMPLLQLWPLYNYFKWKEYNPLEGHNWGHMGSWSETLSVWFSGYNPFLHLKETTFDKYQYVGNYSLFERLGPIFSPLSQPFFLIGYEHSLQIPEYNIWLGLIKSILFDEYKLFKLGSTFFHTIGFDLSVILVILTSILTLFIVVSAVKISFQTPCTLFCTSILGTGLLSFIYFNLTNPVWSACNFRYIAYTFPCLCYLLMSYYQKITLIPNKKQQFCKKVIEFSSFYFVIISCLIYIILGII